MSPSDPDKEFSRTPSAKCEDGIEAVAVHPFGRQPRDAPVFKAELTPFRSLGRNGFFVLMAFIAVTCFSSGIMFMAMGAWPIMLFMAADVLVIWLAFKLSYRSARQYETVEVWQHELLVCKFAPNGTLKRYSFNPLWTRFQVDRHEEIGITHMALVMRDKQLDIGSFLNPSDRESFANAFGHALATARRG